MGWPPGYRPRQELMDEERLARTLARMAHEIVERHRDMSRLAFVGVRSRGVPLARRLAAIVKQASGTEPPVGALDITLYRDDLTTIAPHPVMKGTDVAFSIDGRPVVLVDDVLYTGRTVRAALDELIDFGRPGRIELAVLVDRGHRELPIRADYAGRVITTTRDEIVQVLLREQDGEDRVVLLDRQRSSDAPVRPVRAGKTSRPRPGRRPADPGSARRPAKRPGRPEPPAGRRRR